MDTYNFLLLIGKFNISVYVMKNKRKSRHQNNRGLIIFFLTGIEHAESVNQFSAVFKLD